MVSDVTSKNLAFDPNDHFNRDFAGWLQFKPLVPQN